MFFFSFFHTRVHEVVFFLYLWIVLTLPSVLENILANSATILVFIFRQFLWRTRWSFAAYEDLSTVTGNLGWIRKIKHTMTLIFYRLAVIKNRTFTRWLDQLDTCQVYLLKRTPASCPGLLYTLAIRWYFNVAVNIAFNAITVASVMHCLEQISGFFEFKMIVNVCLFGDPNHVIDNWTWLQ